MEKNKIEDKIFSYLEVGGVLIILISTLLFLVMLITKNTINVWFDRSVLFIFIGLLSWGAGCVSSEE